jgi:serine/threonine-protein kinase
MAAGIPFGDYQLIRRLGAGGMAEVFLAKRVRASGFEKRLVIKRLLPHLSDDERFTALFLNEARIAAMIDHPNLAHVSDFGKADGRYYLAMEYVEGQSLGEILSTLGALAAPSAVRVGIDLAEALQAIHSARDGEGQPLGLVHRDLSPRNVMLRADGVVKLLDLGLVTSRAAEVTLNAGTPGFMSPEQIRGERLDARSDLYALGAVLWRMLGGKAALPAQRPTDLPAPVFEILQKLLAEDKDRRPRSAAEVAATLEAIAASFGAEATRARLGTLVGSLMRSRSWPGRALERLTRLARPTRRVEADSDPTAPSGRRRRLILAAGVVTAFSLALIAALFGRDPAPTSETVDEPELSASTATSAAETSTPALAAARSMPELLPDSPHEITRLRARPTVGFLTIDTDPWSEVYLRGARLGITPIEGLRLPSGVHELELRNGELGVRARIKVVVRPGATTRVHKKLQTL